MSLSRISATRSVVIPLNYVPKRNSFYNKYEHGPTKLSNPDFDHAKELKQFIRGGLKDYLVHHYKRIKAKFMRPPVREPNEPFKTKIFEHFDSDESIKRWKPVADSDTFNGFSTSKISRSPRGHALFHGFLDTRIPDDGLTMKSGFTAIIGPAAPSDNMRGDDSHWDWSDKNTVEIRLRGDGRKYTLVLNTGTYDDDLSYYDVHAYPIYTKGGPYWQTVRIPFSKFVFAYKGLVQDQQGYLPTFRIKFVSFALQDSINGPFALEIDYIGLRRDIYPFGESSPYETYAFPHIKFRPLQVDCEPPEHAP